MPNVQLPQIATYWGSPQTTGFGGLSFATPTMLSCRWEERSEEFIDATGQQRLSRAIVYLEDDVTVGGYLLLGESNAADPGSVDDAYPIQRYSKIPDIRAAKYLRKAWL